MTSLVWSSDLSVCCNQQGYKPRIEERPVWRPESVGWPGHCSHCPVMPDSPVTYPELGKQSISDQDGALMTSDVIVIDTQCQQYTYSIEI